MVSIGTVLTLGIIGAVSIFGYAVYRNADKLGGAVSRGVEKNVTAPFGNYFENLFADTPGNGNGASVPDPTKPAFGLLPEAEAPTPGQVPLAPQEALAIESKYAAQAQRNAELILKSFAPTSQQKLITAATEIAKQSPTPITTQAYSIIDAARVSVGGAEPLTNKFYRLFTLANKPYGAPSIQDRVLPLSREAVQAYAKVGVIAREVYL